MTLPLGNRTDAVGANSTGTYSYTFRILTQNDLRITVRNPSSNVESTLVLTTDYTVSGVGDVGGGSITLVDVDQVWLGTGNFLNTSWPITLRGVESLVQETDIRNQGDYYPEGIEDAFDYQMRISQQQQDQIDRSAKLPETISPATVSMTLPVPSALTLLGWNAAATAITNYVPNTSAFLTKATQSQAQVGTENTAYMTPLRTAEAVAALAPVTLTNAATLTNKRITKRVYSATTLTTLTPEISTFDVFHLTALASALTIANHATSTPTDGEQMIIRLLDNATARALTWGSAYVAKGGTALPTTTTISKNIAIGFEYNSNLAKWNLLAVALEA